MLDVGIKKVKETKRKKQKRKSKKQAKKKQEEQPIVPEEFVVTKYTSLTQLKKIFDPSEKDFLGIVEVGCEVQKTVKR